MSESTDTNRSQRRFMWRLLLGLTILAAVLYFLSRCGSQDRALKPFRPTKEAAAISSVPGRSVAISFPDLNEDPSALRDRRIRVSGAYTGLKEAECTSPKGPTARWALVADELQLDAIGFEQLLRLVPPGTVLSVEGIWRSYNGVAGCGKNAASRSFWYLDVEQIIEPNPLLGASPIPVEGTLEPTPTQSANDTTLSAPSPTPSNADPTATATITPTATGIPTITRTPVVSATPSPPTATPGTAQNTATPTRRVTETATVTATAPPQTTPGSTSTVQAEATATSVIATSQPTQTPLATPVPFTTATPGGYPGPGTNPGSSTATPAGYP